MRKAEDVIGLPVYCLTTAKEIANVKDLVFDRHWKIQGLLVEMKQWFSTDRFIAQEDIDSYGEDAILVDSEQVAVALPSDLDYPRLNTGHLKIKGIPVLTSSGDQLGFIEDVYLKEEVGIIVGYEISDGFIADIKEGRKQIERPEKVILGEDALILPQHFEVKRAEY